MNKNIGAIRYVLLGVAALLTASTAAMADTVTLVCNMTPVSAGSCCTNDGPGTILLDEAAGSVTIHYPSQHSVTSGDLIGNGQDRTFAAKFTSEAINLVIDGRPVTINRLTGTMTDWGWTWTCHVGQKQF